MSGQQKAIYSFVVDRGHEFAYQGWHLAHSLVDQCGASPRDIHVQCTPEADLDARRLFERAGFTTHTLSRFGDGRYCNKIAQLDNLPEDGDIIVLLDTDTIATHDLRPWLSEGRILGKIVDAANPPLDVLREIAFAANVPANEICRTDSGDGDTFVGNCNGGMYAIPMAHRAVMSREWKRWALWLIDNIEPLRRVGKEAHVDQVSFWLTLRSLEMPFALLNANANYFTHFNATHAYLDSTREIALLHYHNNGLNVVGKVEASEGLEPLAQRAIARANEQIGSHFNNDLFWNYRYEKWPERGSGLGSRGDNLTYKRELLRSEGIESAASVLDIGCGDMQVVKDLALTGYTGLDLSSVVLQRAVQIKPDGVFKLGLDPSAPVTDIVLCLEVLIHQTTIEDYVRVVAFAASHTSGSLIVSGYQSDTDSIRGNSMVFFYEPLETSLRSTRRFSQIRQIGAHTDVLIFRCDV